MPDRISEINGTASVSVDDAQAERFLRLLHGTPDDAGTEYAILRKTPKRNDGRHKRVKLGEVPPNGTVAQAAKFDLYATPNGFRPRPAKDHPHRVQRDVTHVTSLFADLDIKPDVPTLPQTEAELRAVLDTIPAPTILVASGSGGVHPYWLLESPVGPEGMGRLGKLWRLHLNAIASEVLGRPIVFDSVQDLSRVLRLPGTIRHPKKPGEQPALVRLVVDDGPRWTTERLSALLPADAQEGGVRSCVSDGEPMIGAQLDAYVTKALTNEVGALAELRGYSGRNNKLNTAAYALARFAARGLLDRDLVYDALRDACTENGLIDDDADGGASFEATFDSGWYAGTVNPGKDLPPAVQRRIDRATAAPVPAQRAAPEDATTAPVPAPPSADELPSPENPMKVARELIPSWERNGVLTLRRWRGQWMSWTGAHWSELDEAAMRADLYPRVEHAWFRTKDAKGEEKIVPWAPNRRKIADLLQAVDAVTHLDARTDAPSWTTGDGPQTVVACRNGILDIATRKLHEPTPRFFNLVSSPLDYEPAAAEPTEWLKFLGVLWPDDPDAVALLQEWFGYVLSGRTHQQKAFLLIGAPRSGKGTIARILTALVGKGHVAAPTLSGMATNFGLSTLIGAPLAIIGDARKVPRSEATTVVERLLSITGEDSLDIDRKYRDPWTGTLPTRFMILSNELPNFADASGAIASRLVILNLTQSFLGREDKELGGRLMAELPGILRWALDGLDSLTRRGYFVQPESSDTAASILAENVSPVRAFLDECCIIGPGESVATGTLFAAWASWCESTAKRDHIGTAASFGIALLAALPGLDKTRPRDSAGNRTWTYVGLSIGNAPAPACDCPDPWCSHRN
jgi:putative DNA primase/helicase